MISARVICAAAALALAVVVVTSRRAAPAPRAMALAAEARAPGDDPEIAAAALASPAQVNATATKRAAAAAPTRTSATAPWFGDAERRAASARALAAVAGLDAEDPAARETVEELVAWLAARPDAEAARGAREDAAITAYNLSAARWRLDLVRLVGPLAAARVAAALPLVIIDPESRELIRVDASGQPTAAPSDWNRS